MAFQQSANMVPDGNADWGVYRVAGDCTPLLAQRLAMRDFRIRSFFYCREAVRLKNRDFKARDAVFVMTQPALKANKACDTYQKDFFNVAYLDPRHTPLRHAGCSRLKDDHRKFFDIACLFAANIHGAAAAARLSFGVQIDHTLNCTDDVKTLKDLGIIVLLSVLGDHQEAGWSCFTNEQAARNFAEQLAAVIETYDLDGIDIDDEYSKGPTNDSSMIMVTSALRKFKPNIIISKALFTDIQYFQATWNGLTLAKQLNYGWEMTYGAQDAEARLKPYTPEFIPIMVHCASHERRHHVWPVYSSPMCRPARQSSWISPA